MSAQISVNIDGENVMLQRLVRFEKNVSNPEPVYGKLADWFAKQQKKKFDRQGAFAGTKWSALSPAYAAWKRKKVGAKPILQFSGELMDQLTKRPLGVEVITKRGLVVGSDLPYAVLHQRGTPSLPSRPPLIQADNKQKQEIRSMVQKWLLSQRG